MSAPQGQVSLDQLSPEQLSQVRSQLEDELKHLTNAYGNLKQAQAKFGACMEALDQITPANADKKVLIPLTSSLYVPGRIKDTENVLVDVGTGYFVEKSTKAAKASYNQKQLSLRSSLATLQEQIEQKQNNFQSTTEMLRAKLSAQAAADKST